METRRVWGTLDPFVEAGPCLGRSEANRGFLQTLFALDPFEEYHFFLANEQQVASVQDCFKRYAPEKALREGKCRAFSRPELAAALSRTPYFCFHLSDCINHPPHLARLHNWHGQDIFPITSVTHSLSYARFAKEFLAHLWAGCTARDVIAATSSAGQRVVSNIFDALRAGYGLTADAFPQPDLVTIPLGIDPEAFTPPGADERKEARAKMACSDEQTLILVFARISPSSKLDMLPVLRALQRIFAAGIPRDALAPLCFDNQYHLLLAQHNVVDVGALADCLLQLIRDPPQRRALGLAARERVLSRFCLTHAVEGFCRLWETLWTRPVDRDGLRSRIHPLHVPYRQVFAGYPSSTLLPESRLPWSKLGAAMYRGRDHLLLYSGLNEILDPETIKMLVFLARNGECVETLLRKLKHAAKLDDDAASYHLFWTLKHDLLEPAPPSPALPPSP